MLMVMTGLLYVLIFFAGAAIFSFLNVVIYRVPLGKDFTKGRSFCPSCGHDLTFLDMIPVFGWLFLGGKCRYCKTRISPRYAIVELFGGIIAVFLCFFYGNYAKSVTVFAFFAILTVIALVDMDTMEIPDGFIVAVLVIGVVSFFTMPELHFVERIVGFFSVSLFLLLIALIIPGAFGGGDIKLMAAAGLIMGWKLNVLALFIAILGGGFYGIILLARKKKGRKDHFAFGPFLCLGLAISLLWGAELINWYLKFWNL